MIQNSLKILIIIISISVLSIFLTLIFNINIAVFIFIILMFLSEFLRNRFMIDEYLISKSIIGLLNVFLIIYYYFISLDLFLLGLFIGLSSYTTSEIVKALLLLKVSRENEMLKMIQKLKISNKNG